MNRKPIPALILGIFLASAVYWIYLALNTTMEISCDAISYERLGRLLQHKGFVPAYFQNGPNREPLYPLLVAIAMHIGDWAGIGYTKIMAGFGVIILSLTQVMIYMLLRGLGIRTLISAPVLIYFAVSPAITNSAFSLYSEIAAYPLMLALVFISHRLYKALINNQLRSVVFSGACLGLVLTGLTLIKGVFEAIAPFYIAIILTTALISAKARPIQAWILGLMAALLCFYVPVTAYKSLNARYNGNFSLTDRGSWALYGSTTRRLQPLTPKRFLSALAYVPGEGVCTQIFGPQACEFWSFRTSDAYGYDKSSQLQQQFSPQAADRQLLQLSVQQILRHPAQYALLSAVEGLKMFFWESTQIGFVDYQAWLAKLYSIKLFNNGLRLLLALLSFAAVIFLWVQGMRAKLPAALTAAALLIFLFITFYAPFFILTRYALPLAPLYLIAIAYCLNLMYTSKNHGHDSATV